MAITDSPRLRLRLALRPRDVLRLALHSRRSPAPERLAQRAFQDLAGARLRQLVGERHRARHLVAREMGAREGGQLVRGDRLPGAWHDHRVHPLAPLVARNAEDGDLLHGGMTLERGFDLRGIDVHAARDDHVALAVADVVEALFVAIRDVADGKKIAATVRLERLEGLV